VISCEKRRGGANNL